MMERRERGGGGGGGGGVNKEVVLLIMTDYPTSKMIVSLFNVTHICHGSVCKIL